MQITINPLYVLCTILPLLAVIEGYLGGKLNQSSNRGGEILMALACGSVGGTFICWGGLIFKCLRGTL